MANKLIHRGLVDPKHLFTKGKYAEKIGVTPGCVTQQIDRGEITVILINGGNIVYDDGENNE